MLQGCYFLENQEKSREFCMKLEKPENLNEIFGKMKDSGWQLGRFSSKFRDETLNFNETHSNNSGCGILLTTGV